VRAMAITVPERSLKTSWLIIKTGHCPACSRRCAALDAGTTGTTDWADVRRQIKAEILRK
jgi:endogenous inhibitor of DNA gyrase (YacG/DUF329 family)